MPAPKLVALDLETCLVTGEASVDFFRSDFRIKSCAFTWRSPDGSINHRFVQLEKDIKVVLEKLNSLNAQIIVHNLAFEYGCVKTRFPDLDLNWYADTMRLTQVADNGGDPKKSDNQTIEQELAGPQVTGLNLTSSVQRWLPVTYHNHKEPYHSYLRENHGIKRKQEGSNLHLLPSGMLEKYNTADTEVTFLLYERLTEFLEAQNYDWKQDHLLYIDSCKLLSDSRISGVAVNRDKLKESIETLESEVQYLQQSFKFRFHNEIQEIEAEKLALLQSMYKTEKGRSNIKLEDYQFNVNSTKDKETLFIGKLGIEPKIRTAKGKPSFKRQFLNQYGEGGQLLERRGTLGITLDQSKKLDLKSQYDGRWHIDLKAAGTVTGRFAGAGGLNIQAMARREPLLMKCIVPDPGHVFVSVDLSAGEPTVTTEFSNDPYYKAAVFDMVGKAPYYDSRNVLLIDDIYLMGMSVSPMGKDRLIRAFYEERFDGLTFTEAWLKNPDIIKKALGKERAFHKILMLGLERFMGPKHMCEDAAKAGYSLTMKEAKAFSRAYWSLFSVIKRKATDLSKRFEREGSIVNMFGYRMIPHKSYQAWAWLIQSSVSGLINVLCYKYFRVFPEAKFVTCIHDEIIMQIPINRLEEAKQTFNKCLDSLNEDLGWTAKVRCGWVPGSNFYEAK